MNVDENLLKHLQDEQKKSFQEVNAHYETVKNIKKKYISNFSVFLNKLCLLAIGVAYLFGVGYLLKSDGLYIFIVALIPFGYCSYYREKAKECRRELTKNLLVEHKKICSLETSTEQSIKSSQQTKELIDRFERDIDI